MNKSLKILICFFLSFSLYGQDSLPRKKHMFVLTSQYAGSIGLVSNGISFCHRSSKLEAGFLYGNLPKRFGGRLDTYTLKFTYNPFKIKLLKNLRWEPVQAGLFFTYYTGKYFTPVWENKYPKRYYWWPKSLRQHIFLSSQLSYVSRLRHLDHFSVYLETNTNDLYLYSYLPNVRAFKFYDILFLGAGVKFYFK